MLIANSNLVGDWANWDEFRRLEAARADDVRPDDRRLVDLHRHPGHPPGHLRDVRGGRREALRRLARGHDHAHRRARRDGRRAAARGDDGRRRGDLRRGRPVAHRAPARDPLPRRRGRQHRPRARARDDGGRPALDRPARQLRRRRPGAAAPRRADRHRDRPDERARPARLPAERDRLRGLGRGAHAARTSSTARASRWPATSRRWSASRTPAPRSSTTATRSAPRPSSAATTRAFDFPGFVPAYIRPLFCEGKGPFRWAALSGDPHDIAATDQAVLDLFPEHESLARWMKLAAEKVAVPGPAGAHLLARRGRAPPGRPALQRAGRERRRSRPRS